MAPTVFIRINPSSGVPIYRQIVDQVKVAIATRQLDVGDQLPSVRSLSSMLEINPTTVQRAYLDLEREGLLRSRRGQGSFVSDQGAPLARGERLRQLREHLEHSVAEAVRLRIGAEELRRLFEEELRRCYPEQEDPS